MKPATKKRLILAGSIAGGFVLLVVIAAFVAARLVDVNSYRPLIEKRLREATGRDVSFGEMSLSPLPLPSVVVNDLVVAAPQPGSPPWIEAAALRARVKLRPLFSGRIEVLGIAIDQPTIRVLRAPDGRLNLQTLMGQKDEDAANERVSFGSLAVRGGRVIVADAFVHPGQVENLELAELDLRVPDLSARPLVATGKGVIAPSGGSFSFDGTLGPGNDLSGTVESSDLDLAALSPWLESLSGMADIRGKLTSNLVLTRSQGQNAAKGRVAVTALVLPVALRGATPLDASLDVDVTAVPGGSVDLRRFKLETGKTALAMTGSIASRDGEQSIELNLARTTLRPADLVGAAAALGFVVPQDVLGGDTIDIEGKAQVQRAGDPRRVTRILVDGLEISGAKLVVRRDEQGRWLVPGAGPPERKGAASKKQETPFAARDVKLRDVSVLLDDRLAGGYGRVEATGVNLTLASYAPGKPGPFDLSARVAGGTLNVKGQVAASGGQSSLDVSVDRASLAELRPLLASMVGAMPSSGTLTWRSHVEGELGKSFSLKGEANLAGARMQLPDGREVTLDLPIEHDMRFEEGGIIRAKSLVIGLPGGKLPLAMQVEPNRFAVSTNGETTLSPESVRWLLALAGNKLPFGFETEAPVTLDARLAKIDGRLAMAGSIAVQRARLTHALLPAPLDIAHAKVSLDGDRIDVEDAALRLGNSALAGKLSVRDLDSPRLTFDLTAQEADLDELFAMTGAASDQGGSSGGGGGPSLVERMRADGRLRVDRATFGGLEMTRFDSGVALADGVLAFDPATLALYGGTARATGRFDLRGDRIGFDVDLGLSGVDVGALLVAGVDYRDLEGRGDATLRLAGAAGTVDATLASLRGTGDMTIRDGVFRGLNALSALKKASVFGEQSLASLGDRLSREGTSYSQLAARFGFDAGVLRIDSLDMATPDADMKGKGRGNLLSQQVDLDLIILFSKALSEQMRSEGSRAAEFFWDAGKGRVSLPARITGPMAEPTATIDYSAAAAQAAKGRLTDILTGALGGNRGGSSSGGTGSGGASGTSNSGGGAEGESRQATGESAQASSEPPSGTLAAGIDSLKFGGPVLAPDLKIRATLSGVDVSHAVVTVADDKGRVLATFKEAFRGDVSTFYATAPRDQPARIPVKLTVDGKSLLGAKTVVVKVVAVDASGATSAEATSRTQRGGLF